MGIKQINDAGGVYIAQFKKKIPLEFLFLDSESDPVKSAGRMDKFYSVDKVDVFLGGFSGILVIPQLATAEKYKTPILVTTVTSESPFQKGYKYIFNVFQTDLDHAAVFFDVWESIPKEQRPKKFSYFAGQDEMGVARLPISRNLRRREISKSQASNGTRWPPRTSLLRSSMRKRRGRMRSFRSPVLPRVSGWSSR